VSDFIRSSASWKAVGFTRSGLCHGLQCALAAGLVGGRHRLLGVDDLADPRELPPGRWIFALLGEERPLQYARRMSYVHGATAVAR